MAGRKMIMLGYVEYLNHVDLAVFRFINNDMSNAAFDRIMPLLTYLGSFEIVLIFIIIFIIFNHNPIAKGLRIGLFISLIYGCVSAVHSIIRYSINRPRPFINHEAIVRAAYPTDPSFPSGHAATAFMMATILSYQFPKYRYIFYILACMVSFSRAYIGVHYPSDVIAGALIGYGVTRLLISSEFIRARVIDESKRAVTRHWKDTGTG